MAVTADRFETHSAHESSWLWWTYLVGGASYPLWWWLGPHGANDPWWAWWLVATGYVVAGVVALCLSIHRQTPNPRTPIKNIDDLLEHLKRTATDAGPQGHDPNYGWGLIDPDSMLAAPEPAPPAVVPPPIWKRLRFNVTTTDGERLLIGLVA